MPRDRPVHEIMWDIPSKGSSDFTPDPDAFPPLPLVSTKAAADADTKAAADADAKTADSISAQNPKPKKPKPVFSNTSADAIFKTMKRYERVLSKQPAHEHSCVMQNKCKDGTHKLNSIIRKNGVNNSEAGHVAAVIESKHIRRTRFGGTSTASKVAPADPAQAERAAHRFKVKAIGKLREVLLEAGASALPSEVFRAINDSTQKLSAKLCKSTAEVSCNQLHHSLRVALPAFCKSTLAKTLFQVQVVVRPGDTRCFDVTAATTGQALAQLVHARTGLRGFYLLHGGHKIEDAETLGSLGVGANSSIEVKLRGPGGAPGAVGTDGAGSSSDPLPGVRPLSTNPNLATAMMITEGTQGPTVMFDSALITRGKAEHGDDLTFAFSHEILVNNNTYSVERRDFMLQNDLVASTNSPFVSVQRIDYHETGERQFCQPTLKIYSNSYMPEAAANHVFDVVSSNIKDSTYGQGMKIAMLMFGADVKTEIYAYDALEKKGTVTMYLLPATTGPNHEHFTIAFYLVEVQGNSTIQWLTPEGDRTAPTQKQDDYRTFRHQTLLTQVRGGIPIQTDTDRRIEEVILNQVVKTAQGNVNKSCVVQFISAESWKDDPPVKKVLVEGETNEYQLMCRAPIANTGAFGWKSLAEIVRKEWRSFPISTKELPGGVSLCYNRKMYVCKTLVTGVSSADAEFNREDWIVNLVEEGLRLDPTDPGFTETFRIRLNEKPRANPNDPPTYNSAVLRVCVHPAARGPIELDENGKQKGMSAGMYQARIAANKQGGGVVFYLGRFHGSGEQLLSGGMTPGLAPFPVVGIPTPDALQTGLSGSADRLGRKQTVSFAKSLGAQPDAAGNIKKPEDLKVLDETLAFGRENAGLDTLWSMTQDSSKDPLGLKPKGRTDFLSKINGYDCLWTLEHNAEMKGDKVQLADMGEAEKLLVDIRKGIAITAMKHDPALAPVKEKVNSEDYTPLKYDNNKQGGDDAPVPDGEMGRPMAGEQLYSERSAKSKRNRARRMLTLEKEVKAIMTENIEFYLGMSTEQLMNGPVDPDDDDEYELLDDWDEESQEFQLRDMLINNNGVDEIQLNSNNKASYCRRPTYAIYQMQRRLDKCTAAVDEEVATERKDRLLTLYKNTTSDLAEDKKRKREDEDDEDADDDADSNEEEFATSDDEQAASDDEPAAKVSKSTGKRKLDGDDDEDAQDAVQFAIQDTHAEAQAAYAAQQRQSFRPLPRGQREGEIRVRREGGGG